MRKISNNQEIAVIFNMDQNYEPTRLIPHKLVIGTYDEKNHVFITTKGKIYDYILVTNQSKGFALRTTVGKLNSFYKQTKLSNLEKKYLQDIKQYFFCYQAKRIDYSDMKFFMVNNKTQEKTEVVEPDLHNILKICNNVGIKTNDLITNLKERIVGQDEAIEDIVSIIWQNIKSQKKSNILILGPSGVGKTEIVRIIAKELRIPLIIANATNMTQSGYVGESVDNILKNLIIQCQGDINKVENSIVVIDEIDKLAGFSKGSEGVATTAVQDELLKMLEDGTYNINISTNELIEEQITIDTKNITFIGIGAFSGLKEEKQTTKKSLGFQPTISTTTSQPTTNKITQEDLMRYGLKPELVGRFSNIIELSPLTKENLIEIMTNTKENTLANKIDLLNSFGIKVEINQKVYEKLADNALTKKTGARGLVSAVDALFTKALLEISKNETDFEKLIIDEQTIDNPKKYTLIKKKTSNK